MCWLKKNHLKPLYCTWTCVLASSLHVHTKSLKPHIRAHLQPVCLQPINLTAAFVHVLGREKNDLFTLLCVVFPFPPAHSLQPRFLSPDWQRVTLPWQPTFGGLLPCPSFYFFPTARAWRTTFRQNLFLDTTETNIAAVERNGTVQLSDETKPMKNMVECFNTCLASGVKREHQYAHVNSVRLLIPGVPEQRNGKEVNKGDHELLERSRCLFLQCPRLFLSMWLRKELSFWLLVTETTAETHAESISTTSGCPGEAERTIYVHGKEARKARRALKEVVRKCSQEGAHTFKELLG